MGLISKMIKTCFAIGAGITAYQASQKTKEETGSMTGETFSRNFMDQAKVNAKRVVDFLKEKLGKQSDGYRVSDKGENGYTYGDGEPAEDKVNKVFETMKEKAPEVIDKVQDIVEDLRDNAPEYKARAQEFVEDVKEAVKKAVDNEGNIKDGKEVKAEETKADAAKESKPADSKDSE
ncbi:MAG: hypothetical protein II885_00580 [Oscillospiraceae bacterium]|nr:hypothetical protein [Oscillospiraceae bacterium]